jgi:ribosome-associated protein
MTRRPAKSPNKKPAKAKRTPVDRTRRTADEVAKIIESKLGHNIEILDIRKKSSVGSFMVVCTGTSITHLRTIADALRDHYKKKGTLTRPWSGAPDSNWIILDLGTVIVHAMGAEERARYALEELWGQSGIIYHL